MSTARIARAALAAAGLASAAACAPTIRSQRDEAIPVPHGATWAWTARDTTGEDQADPTLGGAIARQQLGRAIAATMESKGFRQVESETEADFLLTIYLGAAPTPHRRQARSTVAVGVGWSSRYGRYGRYDPWRWGGGWGGGWYWPLGGISPWGWGWYAPMIVVGAGAPGYGGGYRTSAPLVVVLRLRSTGDVAWRGEYFADSYDLYRISQGRVQEIAARLLADLH